jgi:hypothetical protein
MRFILALLCCLLAPVSAWAAIGTPSTLGTNSSQSGVSSITITTTAAITAGNLVVVACEVSGTSTITSVTVGTNNLVEWAFGAAFGPDLWFVSNAAAVSSVAPLTVGLSASTSQIICYAAQVSGASTEDTGSENFNFWTSSQPSVTSNALATSNEVIFAFQFSQSSITSLSYLEGSGFTTLYDTQLSAVGGLTPYFSFAYQIVSSTSAVTWSPSYSFPPNSGVGIIAAFEGGGSPPPTTNGGGGLLMMGVEQ